MIAASAWAAEPADFSKIGSEEKIDYYFREPQKDGLAYRGMLSPYNSVGRAGNMMYPAPNAVGLIAAVLTHALIADSAQKAAQNQAQQEADKTLSPYQEVIHTINYEQLAMRALGKMSQNVTVRFIDKAAVVGNKSLVECSLAYAMSQDQTALILENRMTIKAAANDVKKDRTLSVRVISPSLKEGKPEELWTRNNGERLIETSALLLAQSLQIGFLDLQNAHAPVDDGKPFQTVRYKEGGDERYERAQIVSNQCNRVLMRTLRGSYMLVPASPISSDTQEEHCASL
jgi:hypothetical protein